MPDWGYKIQLEFSWTLIVFSDRNKKILLEKWMSSQLPTLRQIRYFLAVAETLSFSRAAEACSVTQSTLSGGLQNLEKLLDEKLFERTSRDVTLTRAGDSLLP